MTADLDKPCDCLVLHECGPPTRGYNGQKYQRLLYRSEMCPDCGWSPSLSIPMLLEVARQLVDVLGAHDAHLWALALVEAVQEVAA